MSLRVLLAAACVLLLSACAAAHAAPAQPAVVDQVVRDVCRDRIVLLGELPSHGEATAFQLKAAIARRLVDDCDFGAVLFEAPVYDFLGFQAGVAKGQATAAQLDDAIGGFWASDELADWRRWLFDEAHAGRLYMGGLDDQVGATSRYAERMLPALVADNVPAGMRDDCRAAVERQVGWTYDAAHPFDESEQDRLLGCTRSARERMAQAGRSKDAMHMVDNFYRLIARTRHADDAMSRDESMYRNVAWFLQDLPAHTRVVIWTASVHAARTQGALPDQPLGARLAARHGDEVAAIGFTAFAGLSAMAGAPPRALPSLDFASLEAEATASGEALRYLDREALRALGRRPSRLLGSAAAEDWSTYFDGVVVVREEVAPTFRHEDAGD